MSRCRVETALDLHKAGREPSYRSPNAAYSGQVQDLITRRRRRSGAVRLVPAWVDDSPHALSRAARVPQNLPREDPSCGPRRGGSQSNSGAAVCTLSGCRRQGRSMSKSSSSAGLVRAEGDQHGLEDGSGVGVSGPGLFRPPEPKAGCASGRVARVREGWVMYVRLHRLGLL